MPLKNILYKNILENKIMIDNFYRTKTTLTIINKDDYGFELSVAKEVNNILQGLSTKIQIEYAKMLDDYIYKNIPTNVLEGMKLKIENELMERKLKGNDR